MASDFSISVKLRSNRDLPWTIAALLMRTVGVPSCRWGKKEKEGFVR